jgi:hypothetical protein
MHYVFYGLGGITIIPSAYLLYWSTQNGGVFPLQWSIYLFVQVWLWLAIGRGLQLLTRIADAVAPITGKPSQNESDLEGD